MCRVSSVVTSAEGSPADIDDRVVGYLLGFTRPSFFATGPVDWVEEVAVAPELRRQAVGRALISDSSGGRERPAAGSSRSPPLASSTSTGPLGYDDTPPTSPITIDKVHTHG
jgi:GNAT superfamily N-acetyltransferase